MHAGYALWRWQCRDACRVPVVVALLLPPFMAAGVSLSGMLPSCPSLGFLELCLEQRSARGKRGMPLWCINIGSNFRESKDTDLGLF